MEGPRRALQKRGGPRFEPPWPGLRHERSRPPPRGRLPRRAAGNPCAAAAAAAQAPRRAGRRLAHLRRRLSGRVRPGRPSRPALRPPGRALALLRVVRHPVRERHVRAPRLAPHAALLLLRGQYKSLETLEASLHPQVQTRLVERAIADCDIDEQGDICAWLVGVPACDPAAVLTQCAREFCATVVWDTAEEEIACEDRRQGYSTAPRRG